MENENIPRNINAALYNAWFRKEYPELFSCEIAEMVESCDDCHFCDTKAGKNSTTLSAPMTPARKE